MIDLSSPLDISSWRDKGLELASRIDKEVKSIADSTITVALPSKIEMTQAQYDDLMELSKLDNMFYDEQKMYVTGHNAMEVRVAKPKLTFKEAMGLDDQNFDEFEKSNE
jgi:hypothetical protein